MSRNDQSALANYYLRGVVDGHMCGSDGLDGLQQLVCAHCGGDTKTHYWIHMRCIYTSVSWK